MQGQIGEQLYCQYQAQSDSRSAKEPESGPAITVREKSEKASEKRKFLKRFRNWWRRLSPDAEKGEGK